MRFFKSHWERDFDWNARLEGERVDETVRNFHAFRGALKNTVGGSTIDDFRLQKPSESAAGTHEIAVGGDLPELQFTSDAMATVLTRSRLRFLQRSIDWQREAAAITQEMPAISADVDNPAS